MISAQALKEREWGHFPALRQALETMSVPEHYFGETSVSDNIFDRISRLTKQSILVQEYRDRIFQAAASTGKEQMVEDLRNLESGFEQVETLFAIARKTIEEIRQEL